MTTIDRSNERGIAMIIALFMVLAMSVLGTSLMFVSRSETISSHNYRVMSQARYAAESGIHKAANYLIGGGYAPPATAAELALFTTTTSPVTTGGQVVLLSSDANESTYPVNAVKAAFAAATTGALDVGDATVTYTATAKLLSMRQIFDQYSQDSNTLQTWEITATGRISGAQTAEVEVSAIVERQPMALYSYAAFATANGCAALSFNGGATTDSYDSSTLDPSNPVVVPDDYGGNVGSNGNLTEVGSTTTINGSMSTPREGVGTCSGNNVTAETIVGQATVTEGLTKLSQEIEFPDPVIPDPGTTADVNFTGSSGCTSVAYCSLVNYAVSGPAQLYPTIDPAGNELNLGDVKLSGNAQLHLKAGTYNINSIDIEGNSQIVIESGPVVFKVFGEDVEMPIKIAGNGISNPSLVPTNLQFLYDGDDKIYLEGGTETAALFYAPNARGEIGGSSDLYGSIIVHRMTGTGGASIHYDRNLERIALTAGNYMMSAFTWKNYPD